MRNIQLSRWLIGTLLVFLLLLSNVGSVVIAQDPTPESDELPVQLVFVNALTALDKVDVYLNGDEAEQRVIEGIEYGTTSETVEGTAPGTVVAVRQNVNWGIDRDIFSTMIPTEPGHTYVVVISDFFIIPVELVLGDPRMGDARSIGVHAAAEAPPVDAYVSEAAREIPLGNLVPLFEDLQYGFSTQGGPTRTGDFDLRLTETGTNTVVMEQESVSIEPNTSYVFVLIGKPGSSEQPLAVVSVSQPIVS